MRIDRGRNLERRHYDCGFGRFGKVARVRNLSSKNQRERSIDITKKREECIFPVADGTAKLSGRDHESRELTPRREQTVKSEDLSGELQGEPGEPQPTESKDDAEAHADFWSIQGDFIYRHHKEPRVQLYVAKEETFLIPLIWMSYKRNELTITGMSIRAGICQILEEDSQSSL